VTLNQVRVENTRNSAVFINNVSSAGAGTGAVTVSGLTILNAFSGLEDELREWNGGLYINSKSPISINGLFVKDNDGRGVLIRHGAGAVTIKNGYVGFSHPYDTISQTFPGFGIRILGGDDPVGAITVDNVRLYDNSYTGLVVETAGAVKLNNVFSSGNRGGYGLEVGGTVTSLTITNSQFKWNFFGGVNALVRGPVSIANTEISGNWGEDFNLEGDDAPGLYLDNRFLSGAAVTITGVRANDNKQNGITILTRGSATLTNIEAYKNRIAGLVVDSSDGLGSVTINTSTFNDNKSIGLSVSSSKNITLKLVEASNNFGFGAWLDNDSGTGAVTLLGLGTSGNHFHRNGENGLAINTSGTVTITNISTDGNIGSGVYIDNSSGLGGVSILAASPNWMNVFSWNGGEAGLAIYSKGSIRLVNVSAWDNVGYGAYLDNCKSNGVGCTGTGSVTISSLGTSMVNAFNNNTHADLENYPYSGLYVTSFGSISLTNVEASRNGKTGIHLENNHENPLGISSAGNITVNNLTRREFSDNGWLGISALSYGNITIKGVNANNNFIRGGQFGNWGAPAARTVTISNSTFNGSQNGAGLVVVQNGKVILSSVSANWNDMFDGGIWLWNSIREKISWNRQGQPDTWTYTGLAEITTIAGYFGSGDFTPRMTIYDTGTYTDPIEPFLVFDSATSPNWFDGYFRYDTTEDHNYQFVIAGDEEFYSGRYTFELYEYTDDDLNGVPDDYGKVFPNDGLGGSGIYIYNAYGTAGVTVTNPVTSRAEVKGNSGDGLFIRSNGAVTVNNLNAYDNGNAGVSVTTNNDNPLIPATVTLSGLLTNWNGGHGVGVQTLGSIVYSSSTSGGNGYYAAWLDNCREIWGGACEAAVMKPVTLTKLNFDNNAYGPAVVNSFGSITAGGIKSQWNNGSGLALFNNFIGSTGNITLLGTLGQNVFEGNALAGMRIYSNGNVTLSNFLVKNNGSYYNDEAYDPEALSAGMYVSAGGKILLSSGTVDQNNRAGILIDSYNSVTMSKMLVVMNGWFSDWTYDESGIEIRAHNVSPVTITSSLIFGNAKHAILIHDAVGAPLLTGTVYFGNDLDGSGDADVEY
jgi:putative surface-exposed virulence protein